jgi:hypothetical protein
VNDEEATMREQARSRRWVLGSLAALAAASAAFGGGAGAAAAADGTAPEEAGSYRRCRQRCYVDAYGRRRCRWVCHGAADDAPADGGELAE